MLKGLRSRAVLAGCSAFRGKASLITVLNNMALSLLGLDIPAAGDI